MIFRDQYELQITISGPNLWFSLSAVFVYLKKKIIFYL